MQVMAKIGISRQSILLQITTAFKTGPNSIRLLKHKDGVFLMKNSLLLTTESWW